MIIFFFGPSKSVAEGGGWNQPTQSKVVQSARDRYYLAVTDTPGNKCLYKRVGKFAG